MGWFTKKTKAMSAADMGLFLPLYARDPLLTREPTAGLRSLLNDEAVPEECREGFDLNAFVLILFIAFLAARRRYSAEAANAILAAALAPLMEAGDDDERQTVSDRLDYYASVCPPESNRGNELAAIAYLGCTELFGCADADFVIQTHVGIWVGTLIPIGLSHAKTEPPEMGYRGLLSIGSYVDACIAQATRSQQHRCHRRRPSRGFSARVGERGDRNFGPLRIQ